MNNPKDISVIIPCYNNASYIVETIESVIAQDYQSIEIIVVNDGSTDNSEAVIYNIIEQHPTYKIKYLYQDNAGPSRARNNGAKLAIGKYLLFLDGDDKIEPTYLTKCVNRFENDSNLKIVYCNAEFFDAQNGTWILPPFSQEKMLTENCIHISGVVKREMFNLIGCFDENLHFYEDWDLWLRFLQQPGDVYKIEETLFYYRKRKDNSSLSDNRNTSHKADKNLLYIYNKHYDLYRNNGFDITTLIDSKKFKKKYYDIWYKKAFLSLKNITKKH